MWYSELLSGLLELWNRPNAKSVDWNNHEWITGIVNHMTGFANGMSVHEVSYTTIIGHRFSIKNLEFWAAMEMAVKKTQHRYQPKGFGYVYTTFLNNPERGSQELRELLASRLPRTLWKMPLNLIVECFRATLKAGLMNEHLFDNHFYVLFWRRNRQFGPHNYSSIIEGMIEYKYKVYPKPDFNPLPTLMRMQASGLRPVILRVAPLQFHIYNI